MPWLKVDDQLWSHPKFAGLSDAAQALWLRAGTWSSAHLTGGFVAESVVRSLLRGRPAVVRELVDAPTGHEHGLWEAVEGGYRFHDWDVYQPDAEVEKDRRAEVSRVRSEAGKRGAQARWGDGKRDGKPVANARQDDGKPMAPSPSPSPSPNPNPVSPDGETRAHESEPPVVDVDARFEEAWKHWPKKQKRKPALARFLVLVKRKPVEELVAAIIQFGDAYTAAGTPSQFVPGLEVWLNQERWDELLPAAPGAADADAWMQPSSRTQRNIAVVERFARAESRGEQRDRELRAFATAADPIEPEPPAADFVLDEDGSWGERRS